MLKKKEILGVVNVTEKSPAVISKFNNYAKFQPQMFVFLLYFKHDKNLKTGRGKLKTKM